MDCFLQLAFRLQIEIKYQDQSSPWKTDHQLRSCRLMTMTNSSQTESESVKGKGSVTSGGEGTGQQKLCSREQSRSVRSFIRKEIFATLSIEPSQLPGSCQINPVFDPFLDQESNKEEIQKGEWRCKYCKKVWNFNLIYHKLYGLLFNLGTGILPWFMLLSVYEI